MPVYNLIYIVIKMAVNFSFMKSQKGKDLLVVDEYTFSYDKKYNGSVYWRCTVSVCKRRAILVWFSGF
jgi:hypothetical protein